MRIQHQPFPKVAARTASSLVAGLDLSADAKALAVDDLSPQGFLAVLADNGHWTDAVRFMAFALPAREAVWWACAVCRAIGSSTRGGGEACLDLAERWVFEPSAANGQACLAAAEALGFEGAPAYAALAAFWTGPSLVPDALPAVPPDPRLCPIGASASVLLAVAGDDPLRAADLHASAIRIAVDIANGGNGRPADADAEGYSA